MTNGNEPINSIPDLNNHPSDWYGLTKREYFALMAMQGLLTRVPKRFDGETDLGILESKRIAEESVIMADELIKALNKGGNNE